MFSNPEKEVVVFNVPDSAGYPGTNERNHVVAVKLLTEMSGNGAQISLQTIALLYASASKVLQLEN